METPTAPFYRHGDNDIYLTTMNVSPTFLITPISQEAYQKALMNGRIVTMAGKYTILSAGAMDNLCTKHLENKLKEVERMDEIKKRLQKKLLAKASK